MDSVVSLSNGLRPGEPKTRRRSPGGGATLEPTSSFKRYLELTKQELCVLRNSIQAYLPNGYTWIKIRRNLPAKIIMRRKTLILVCGSVTIVVASVYVASHFERRPAIEAPIAPAPGNPSLAAPFQYRLNGQWRVGAVAGASPVTSMDGAAAASLVGKLLDVETQGLRFMNETCTATYANSAESSSEFVQDFRVDPSTLNLPAKIIRTDGGCTDIFVLGQNEILFTWHGYFLDARREPSG